jgi:hypothetical protein
MLAGVNPMAANDATTEPDETKAADTRVGTPCKMCRERYQGKRPEHFGSDPRCAFPDGGPFTGHNWQCATANAIRDIAEAKRDGVVNDWSAGGSQSTALIRIDNDYPVGWEAVTDAHCLVVTWYKSRGCTGGMWLIGDEDDPSARPPTEAEALSIIEHYAAEKT